MTDDAGAAEPTCSAEYRLPDGQRYLVGTGGVHRWNAQAGRWVWLGFDSIPDLDRAELIRYG